MHCPGCGNQSSLDQKFCRKCGFNLEPVSQLVSGHIDHDQTVEARSERDRRLVRRMVRWISWGCLVILAGVIFLVLNRGFIHEAMFVPLSSLLMLAGVAMATYGVLSAMIKGTYLPEKTSARKQPEAIGPGQATNELPEANVPAFPPSVAERTTQLIGSDVSQDRN